MSTLRTSYGRVIKPAASGSAGKDPTMRQRWLIENLGFLKEYIKPKGTTRSNMAPQEVF